MTPMFAAWFFVFFPLALYLPLFLIETIWSIIRLRQTNSSNQYFSLSWEVTHTLLVMSVNAYLWLFSDTVDALAPYVAVPLMIVIGLFFVRTILYIVLFYTPADQFAPATRRVVDWGFAFSHIGLVISLVVVLVRVATRLMDTSTQPNTQFLPYLWPGLLFMVLICAIPLSQIYLILHRSDNSTDSEEL